MANILYGVNGEGSGQLYVENLNSYPRAGNGDLLAKLDELIASMMARPTRRASA